LAAEPVQLVDCGEVDDYGPPVSHQRGWIGRRRDAAARSLAVVCPPGHADDIGVLAGGG
jgi:hypothetical protein